MLDLHTHTLYSHDSKALLSESCEAAIASGISTLAFTDHADLWYWEERDVENRIHNSYCAAESMKANYPSRLKVLSGVEMGEAIDCPSKAQQLLDNHSFDVVLASVHCLEGADWKDAYSQIDFSEQAHVSLSRIEEFFSIYLTNLLKTAQETDYDILAHLDVPLRYINGKYKRGLDILKYKKQILSILEVLIKREKVLEINTSGFAAHSYFHPSDTIVQWYLNMGGTLFTTGSDAHVSSLVGNHIDTACEYLLSKEIHQICYFEKRVLQLKEIRGIKNL